MDKEKQKKVALEWVLSEEERRKIVEGLNIWVRCELGLAEDVLSPPLPNPHHLAASYHLMRAKTIIDLLDDLKYFPKEDLKFLRKNYKRLYGRYFHRKY